MIVMRQTPDQAHAPLLHASPSFVAYRDAGGGDSTYFLSIHDHLCGFYKAMQVGLIHMDKFDLRECQFYGDLDNGDMHWITEKFLALATPKDDRPNNALKYGGKSQAGLPLKSALRKSDLIAMLKSRGVGTIVRLNSDVYGRQDFVDAGIEHIDLYFEDGSNPPDDVLNKFIDLCESRGKIAVHCMAGLGRTASLIAVYLMKHYQMTAAETIGFFRVMRPGSVVGPQQNWLERFVRNIYSNLLECSHSYGRRPQRVLSALRSLCSHLLRSIPIRDLAAIRFLTFKLCLHNDLMGRRVL
jgi:cell division cycle 14